MAYFGNQPISASYLTDYFSGNNTTVAFTLSRAPVSASAVIITISGVKQAASTYGVSGTTLTFSAAPPTGTNNIEVLHLGVQPDTVVQPSYRTITEFTATAGQTTFSPASYTAGYIDVYRNGVKLGTADYTATNGTSVVLANACTAGDLVRFEGFLITSFNNAIPNTNGAVGSSLLATGAALSNIGTGGLPQSALASGVAGTGPVMFVHRATSAQIISQNTWTRVQFNSLDVDTGGMWDAGNYRFIPKVAGYYMVSCELPWVSGPSRSIVRVRKNGGTGDYSPHGIDSATSTFYSTAFSAFTYANGSTDYFEIWAYHNNASSEGVSFTSAVGSEAYLGVVLIRAA
jgi:hypothetical protein